MRFKKITPGMVIGYDNKEEKEQLLQELEKQGYLWSCGSKPTEDFATAGSVYVRDANARLHFRHIFLTHNRRQSNIKFSDLIIPDSSEEDLYLIFCKNSEQQKTGKVVPDPLSSVSEYNRGLNDAWELVKKIWYTEERGGYPSKLCVDVLGTCNMGVIFENFTPQEALAKLEAYEKEQDVIKVGDVVTDGYSKMLVTGIGGKSGMLFLLGKEGEILVRQKPECWEKTGKHIDGIQSILVEIGKE